MESNSQYLADDPPTVVRLEIARHFEELEEGQKWWVYWMSRAIYHGTRIILRQVSPESEDIFDLVMSLYHSCGGDWKKLQAQTEVSDQHLDNFLSYVAQFLGNFGNYKGFGDTKFIPRLSPSAFSQLVSRSLEARSLFGKIDGIASSIFANTSKPSLMHLGFPDQGHMSAYYPESSHITKADIELVSAVMSQNNILSENTRLHKLISGDFELLIASADLQPSTTALDMPGGQNVFPLPPPLDGKSLYLKFGDHSSSLSRITSALRSALPHAASSTQKSMLEAYIASFTTGSMAAYKAGQIHWVHDRSPPVECNIGFVETYRDPAGVRAEFEGFVALPNAERTRMFSRLVAAAPALLPALPWGPEFEQDVFRPPDFASLEVLAYASSVVPPGINIPNFNDIRAEHGFKNVCMGNVMNAGALGEEIPFVHAEDVEMYKEFKDRAFEVQVGIHELLGHGSGKLLAETEQGVWNFERERAPVNPLTGERARTWYQVGETFSSIFGEVGASFEECRAECVAVYLACDFRILQIFGADIGSTVLPSVSENIVAQRTNDGKESDPYANVDTNSEAFRLLHIAYLSMARAGLAALEFWDPSTGKWGQAHMQARWSILRCFLCASSSSGKAFCTVTPGPQSRSASDREMDGLCVRIDPMQILTAGRRAVAEYLLELHVTRCTADAERGKSLYSKMTAVLEAEHGSWWVDVVRPAVLRQKVPRKIFVMANVIVIDERGRVLEEEEVRSREEQGECDGLKVDIREYEATREGMVRAWGERDI